jgi:putative oxidoreductase
MHVRCQVRSEHSRALSSCGFGPPASCRLFFDGVATPVVSNCRHCSAFLVTQKTQWAEPLERGGATKAFWGVKRPGGSTIIELGCSLQRLFSTFPDGWPGLGLLLLRLGAAITVIYCGVSGPSGVLEQSFDAVLRLVAVGAGLLLLLGLWTPIAGTVVAIDELWSAFSQRFPLPAYHWLYILLAVLGTSVAMLGPGAWSIDARLFGRKRFEINGRNRRNVPTK